MASAARRQNRVRVAFDSRRPLLRGIGPISATNQVGGASSSSRRRRARGQVLLLVQLGFEGSAHLVVRARNEHANPTHAVAGDLRDVAIGKTGAAEERDAA